MRYVTYERTDGTLGIMWEHDWLRIMESFFESSRCLYPDIYPPQITYKATVNEDRVAR